MDRNDNNGFNINESYGEEAPKRKAYDQDKDNGIGSNYTRPHKRPESESSDLYKEYMNQYEKKASNRYAEDNGGKESFIDEAEEESIVLSSYSPKAKKKKDKKKKKKALIITISAVVLIIAILVALLWPYLNYNRKKITKKPKELGFSEVINDKIVNIALFGLDTRDKNSFKGRSDSIMILSLNTETKKVKVISLMRDTIVSIEGKKGNYFSKINSAYQSGGPELAIKTINKTFDLDISNYATINFSGMVDIIDAVGGIDAEITKDELTFKGNEHPNLNGCMIEICAAKGLNPNDYYIKNPGPQHLNGVQAVAYSRIRICMSAFGTTDDYGRTDRQRHVMEQLFTRAVNLPKTKYAKLAKALIPCSETSLGIDDIVSLAFDVLLGNPTFVQCRIPQKDWVMPFNYSGYGSCVYFDMDYATRAIHAIIYDDMTVEQFVEAHPVEKNDWFAKYGKKTSGSGTGGGTTGNSSGTVSTPEETQSQVPSGGESQTGGTTSETTSGTTGGTTENPEPKEEQGGEEKPQEQGTEQKEDV